MPLAIAGLISTASAHAVCRQLESVSGVGQVVVVGGRPRQININLDTARLTAYNLTVTDVSRALLAASYGHLGRMEEARRAWSEMLKINPDFSL